MTTRKLLRQPFSRYRPPCDTAHCIEDQQTEFNNDQYYAALEAHWALREHEGTVAYDCSPHNRHLKSATVPAWVNDTTDPLACGHDNDLQAFTRDSFVRGNKHYELKNHLGNVQVVITDRKIGVDMDADSLVDFYLADLIYTTDYYPFGLKIPEREYIGRDSSTRYGFNGMEQDMWTSGVSKYDFGARYYSPSVARWMSVDPVAAKFTSYSPYHAMYNSPIITTDVDGRENVIVVASDKIGSGGYSAEGYRKSFLRGAARFYNEFKKSNPHEKTTILINTNSLSREQVSDLVSVAEAAGVDPFDIQVVTNKNEIISYVNRRPTSAMNSFVEGPESMRAWTGKDLITDLVFIGHGSPGNIFLDYGAFTTQQMFFPSDIKSFDPSAFQKGFCSITFQACQTGVGVNGNKFSTEASKYLGAYSIGSNDDTYGNQMGLWKWQYGFHVKDPSGKAVYSTDEEKIVTPFDVPQFAPKESNSGANAPSRGDNGLFEKGDLERSGGDND